VLYRAADRLALRWRSPASRAMHPGFSAVATSALALLDALPARCAAAACALVGNFTGAAEGWQGAMRERRGDVHAAMVAAGLGALGMEAAAPAAAVTRAQRDAANEHYDGAGWDADSYAIAVERMDGAAALVWRSLLVWLAAVALLAFAF
jgi:membrane protein required for beta-lactamase induction